MEESFKIRSYGYGELALLYFPKSTKKSASVQFGRWIRINGELQSKLKLNLFRKGQKLLTPKQVELITSYLGEP